MIDAKQAIANLKRKYPKRKITAVIDYDPHWWLLEAPEGEGIDYDSPYYVVNKQSGGVKTYSPMADFNKFKEVYTNNRVNVQ